MKRKDQELFSTTASPSRRRFLKNTAMGAAGLAGASAMGSMMPHMASASDDPLVFGFWPWGSEIVTSNADAFMAEYNENVELMPIPGDYAAVLETKLASGTKLDMFYAQRGQAARWHAAGWIRPINDLPGLDQIRSEMFEGLDFDSLAPNGDYLGLTYYNGGPFCLFRNEKLLDAGGHGGTANASDYPTTWEEIANISRDLKKKGISEHPLMLSWYKAWTGLPWALTAHCFSEGEYLIDNELRATFDENTPILKVLTDWKQWWDEGLIPPGILTMQESTMLNAYATGNHAFCHYMDYAHFIFGDKTNDNIGPFSSQNPLTPGATNDTVLVGHALLCMDQSERDEEDLLRAWNLMKFYGWKNSKGEYHTHKRWVEKADLPVPFPEIYSDPESKAALMKWMHPEFGEQAYQWQYDGRLRAMGPNHLKAPWYQEWDAVMHDMLANDLILKGSITPTDAVKDLRKLWDKLHKKYT
jgi:multiple sugar transport system substrate-binding protein